MAITLNFFAPHTEAAAAIADKPVVSRDVFYGLLPELRQRAFAVTGLQAADVMERVRDEIAAVPRGAKWEDARAQIADTLEPYLGDAAQNRAELLLRTHGFQAFQAATWRAAQADADTEALQYLTMEDDRVRPSHAALDGIIVPKNDPFWDTHTPPWDWGCRCRIRPMNSDLVEMQRQKDRMLNPEDRLVIEGAELNQLRSGTVIASSGQRVDVTPPSQRPGGQDAFQWHPDNLTLPIGELKLRYSPQAWQVFEDFAKRTEVAPGTTLWNSLMSATASATPAEQARQTQQTITRIAELTGNATLGGRNADAVKQLAQAQFTASSGAIERVRPGDFGADTAREVAAVTREFTPQWAAEISAVATGRKPLFHEDLNFLNQDDLVKTAAEIARRVPAGIEVRLRDGHLYVYNPALLTQFTGGAAPPFAEVVAHRDDGQWLGYGINHPIDHSNAVQIVIQDAYGRKVESFFAPKAGADYFAAQRTLDWENATGRQFTFVKIEA